MKFLSPEYALYLYHTVLHMAGAPNCYLDILDKLQKDM